MQNHHRSLQVTELLLIVFPLITLIITSLGFFRGISITPTHFWLSLIFTLTTVIFLPLPNTCLRTKCIGCLTMLAFFFLALLYSSLIHKLTWDGQAYHHPTIESLYAGWNPFKAHTIKAWNPTYAKMTATYNLLSSHFARGAETIGAVIYAAIGTINAASALTIWLIIATFLCAKRYLSKTKTFSTRLQLSLAIILALNPVAIVQVGTFYVDGILTSLLTILVIALLDYTKFKEQISLFEASAAFALLCNIKFTGFIYGAIFVGFFLIFILIKERQSFWRFFSIMTVASIIAIVLIGYQPYITNTITHGTPFYPINSNAHKIIASFSSERFANFNRLTQYIISLFDNKLLHLFNYNTHHLIIFPQNEDLKLNGFGFFFGYVLVLSLILLYFTRDGFSYFLVGTIFLSIFITPMEWWARLAPQSWLIPPLIIAVFLAKNTTRPTILKIITKTSLSLLVITTIVTSVLVLTVNIQRTIKFNHALNDLKQKNVSVTVKSNLRTPGSLSTIYYLKKHHIAYQLVSTAPTCKQQKELPYLLNGKVYWNCSARSKTTQDI